MKQTRIDFGKVDGKLIDDFRTECRNRNLIDGLAELCRVFHRWRSHYPQEMTGPRNRTIAELRSRLAHVCVDALEPDLIVLDEFQRFTELLHGNHDAALLARDLFDYTDRKGNAARTLLLSATPYRMLTLSGDTEDEGNHYREFLDTLRFLFGHERGPEVAEEMGREVDRFRRAILSLPNSKETARGHKLSIEERLRTVIARTERIASTRGPRFHGRGAGSDRRCGAGRSALGRCRCRARPGRGCPGGRRVLEVGALSAQFHAGLCAQARDQGLRREGMPGAAD